LMSQLAHIFSYDHGRNTNKAHGVFLLYER
jgi:hypothetical protein